MPKHKDALRNCPGLTGGAKCETNQRENPLMRGKGLFEML